MLDEREIDIEIARLEYMESSYANYAKLANLYTIKNQMKQTDPSSKVVGTTIEKSSDGYGESEFLREVSYKNASDVFEIIDDLMDTLSTVYPKVYHAVMRRIQELP